nr:hypothetical protein [Tanacetum cinerariifolium]
MSTRSSTRKIFSPLDNPKLTIRRRSRADPTLLNDFEMTAEGNGDPPFPDLRTMEELCQPSLNCRGGPISPITIQATNFGLKNDMIQQVHNSFQFLGLSGDDANKHLDKFLDVTQSIKLRNEITNFRQCPDESLFEAWERYKLSIDQCGTFIKRRPVECFDLIENMTAHHNDWDTSAQRSESSSSITSSSDTKIAALKAKMAEINKNLMRVLQVNQQVKAVTPSCETCGGPHSYTDYPATFGQTQNVYAAGAYQGACHVPNPPPAYQAPAYQALGYQAPVHQPPIPLPQVVTTNEFTKFMKANDVILKNMQTNMTSLTNSNLELKNMFGQFMKMNTASSSGLGTLPGNTITNLKEELKGIITRSRTAYQGPTIPTTSSLSKVVECETEVTKDTLVVAPVSAPKPNQKPSIPYPSRFQDQKLRDKANDQKEKIFKIFQDLNFNISFADALILMPKFGPTIKTLLTNKDKLTELARTPLNEHCSMILLKKLPEKVGDPGKFIIPCDFPRMDESLALADLGASINLMPLSMWNKISLPELSPTCMNLELADRSISRLVGTRRALIDVFEGELTLRVGKEAITFNLDQTLRYSANYNDMTANQIDVIDMDCKEYSQEVLGFSDMIASGNPTPYYDPIVSTSSLTLTPFGDSDFLLEEFNAFLALKDDATSLEVELKDLSPHLEYVFLEGDDKLPVILAKDLSDEEKTALIKVLKSHKQAIAWKLSDIKGIASEFCTHKILMEDDFKQAVQHQRRVNPKIHDVIKKEVLELTDAGLIYPISDSPWVSLVHCVSKKGDFTVVENEKNELIMTRLVTGWRVCIDYRKLNEATRKDHFSLPFMDQMLERLAGNDYYCFLDGFSGNSWILKTCAKGAENLAADHLSRLENPHQSDLEKKEITETFPLETLGMVNFRDNVFTAKMPLISSRLAIMDPPGDIMVPTTPLKKPLILVFIGLLFTEMPMTWSPDVTLVNVKGKYRNVLKSLKMQFKFARSLTYAASISWARSRLLDGTSENRASWSEKLDDALWAFRTAFKTPIGCTTYKLVYEKACHLPIKLEHKAYWALKHCNYDLKTVGDHRKVQHW